MTKPSVSSCVPHYSITTTVNVVWWATSPNYGSKCFMCLMRSTPLFRSEWISQTISRSRYGCDTISWRLDWEVGRCHETTPIVLLQCLDISNKHQATTRLIYELIRQALKKLIWELKQRVAAWSAFTLQIRFTCKGFHPPDRIHALRWSIPA